MTSWVKRKTLSTLAGFYHIDLAGTLKEHKSIKSLIFLLCHLLGQLLWSESDTLTLQLHPVVCNKSLVTLILMCNIFQLNDEKASLNPTNLRKIHSLHVLPLHLLLPACIVFVICISVVIVKLILPFCLLSNIFYNHILPRTVGSSCLCIWMLAQGCYCSKKLIQIVEDFFYIGHSFFSYWRIFCLMLNLNKILLCVWNV